MLREDGADACAGIGAAASDRATGGGNGGSEHTGPSAHTDKGICHAIVSSL